MTMPQPELDPRVLFAAERTLLAWIRTGIAMMGFGFIVARFGLFLRELAALGGDSATGGFNRSPAVGTALILLGGLVTLLATVEHVRFVRRYARGEPVEPKVFTLVTALAALIVITGVGLAIYLMRA